MSISHISRFKTDLTVISLTVFSSRKHILVMNRVFPPDLALDLDLALAMRTISDDLRFRDILCLCDSGKIVSFLNSYTFHFFLFFPYLFTHFSLFFFPYGAGITNEKKT